MRGQTGQATICEGRETNMVEACVGGQTGIARVVIGGHKHGLSLWEEGRIHSRTYLVGGQDILVGLQPVRGKRLGGRKY